MSDRKTLFPPLDQLAGLTQGPARLVIDDWRRFFAEQTHVTRAVCRTVRGVMRSAAEETLKARDTHVGHLETRLAALEAEIARLRTARPESD